MAIIFHRFATSALALMLGSGMFILSGCDNDCDNCDEKPVKAACCDENVPMTTVNAEFEERTEDASVTQRDTETEYTSDVAPSDVAPAVDMGTKPAVRARQER